VVIRYYNTLITLIVKTFFELLRVRGIFSVASGWIDRATVCGFLSKASEAMCHAGGFKEMRIVQTECIAKGDPQCTFQNKSG
jgi:hypothetical protein